MGFGAEMEEEEGIPVNFASESAAADLKGLVEKRCGDGLEEKDEFGCKRVKLRDLDSGLALSDEATTHKRRFVENTEIIQQSNLRGKEISSPTKMALPLDAEGSEMVWGESDALPLDLGPSTTRKVPAIGASMANANSISTDNDSCTGKEMRQNGKAGSPASNANNVMPQLRQTLMSRSRGREVEEPNSLQGWKEKNQNGSLSCPPNGKDGLFELGSSADPSGEHVSLESDKRPSQREISSCHNAEELPQSADHVLCRLRQMSESRSLDGAAEESYSRQGWKEVKQNDCDYDSVSGSLCGKAGPFELASSADPLGESDSMRRWKEMKRNGFLSGPLGGVAASSSAVSSSQGEMPIQKQQNSKRKGGFKKKREPPKKEQIDRFSNIATPSGLLTEFNPGIINHVRSREQVLAIIRGLVKIGAGDDENDVGLNESDTDYSHLSQEDVLLADANKTIKHSEGADNSSAIISEGKIGWSMTASVGEDGIVSSNLSSNEASENAIATMNVESANTASAAPLTVEAATVASQWLELLHRDIDGRLSALQRSRKRLEGVVTMELPLLVLKEFPSNQDNSSHVMNASGGDELSDKTAMEWHQSKWTLLFDQINKALSDEERDLECWLHQVKEMMSHCSQGLQHMDLASSFTSQSLDMSETDSRACGEPDHDGLCYYADVQIREITR